MLLDGRVHNCGLSVTRVGDIVNCLRHQIVRRICLVLQEVATVAADTGVTSQWIDTDDSTLEVLPLEHKLSQCQHIRGEELAVAVEITPNLIGARRAPAEPSAGNGSRVRTRRDAPGRRDRPTPQQHAPSTRCDDYIPPARHNGHVLHLRVGASRVLHHHGRDFTVDQRHTAAHNV
eukprot:3520102-Prymnesium_polylepis.1